MRIGKEKYYALEREEFIEQFNQKLSWTEIEMVHKKLCRHYKIPTQLRFNGRRCGLAHAYGLIEIGPQGMNIGVLCHEVSHIIAYRKYHTMKHTRQMYRMMRGVMKYAKQCNYWKNELDRRTAPKPFKPLPTKNELQEQKIAHRKAQIIGYEKKLAYYNKLYTNKIKKAKKSIVMLEQYLKRLNTTTYVETLPIETGSMQEHQASHHDLHPHDE